MYMCAKVMIGVNKPKLFPMTSAVPTRSERLSTSAKAQP